jgi:hypothetical protein
VAGQTLPSDPEWRYLAHNVSDPGVTLIEVGASTVVFYDEADVVLG